jgi:ProP effector
LLKDLQDKFPVFRDCQPLAIGIDKQLLTRMPEINRKVLRIALGIHTNSLRYLKTMEKAKSRMDLDGNEAGEVPDTHRVHATKVLRERSAKNAERRALEVKAQETAKLAALEEKAKQERAEKLSQLAEKFSRN